MNLDLKPARGFLLGKFMPPHNGHVYLCDFAREYCQELTILVCSLPDEPIDGKLRYEWMKELFPSCNVIWCNEVLPQEPIDENDSDFWKIWKDVINRYTTGKFDVVFASEDYGHRLAKELDSKFIPCDIQRVAQNISGTSVRNNAYDYWKYLPSVVRPYFVKRVCIFGPESCGKSTLAGELKEVFNTEVVPEYGRTYTEIFGADVNKDDLENIVRGHLSSVKALKRHANKVLIEDTDPIMTAVWSDMLTDSPRDKWFDEYTDYADAYILCDIDIPWVNDGTRYFPKDADRKRFFDICERELLSRGVRFITVSGNRKDRLKKAVKYIATILNDNKYDSTSIKYAKSKRAYLYS